MNLKTELVKRLLADNAIKAIVGTQVYRERMPKGAKAPYIVIGKADTTPIMDYDGYAYTIAIMEVFAFSDDEDVAHNLAKLARASLWAWNDIMSGFVQSEDDIFEPETSTYCTVANYRISYHE